MLLSPILKIVTASPSSSSKSESEMQEEINRLCNLIQGNICMPKKYLSELKVNLPKLCFKLVSKSPNCHDDVKNCKILI